MSKQCAACYCKKFYCRKCKGMHQSKFLAKIKGARYGPYSCKLPKGHDLFCHSDGNSNWAPLQRWRAEIVKPKRKESFLILICKLLIRSGFRVSIDYSGGLYNTQRS